MLIGQTLVSAIAPTKANYATPWVTRQGNSVTAVIQVLK